MCVTSSDYLAFGHTVGAMGPPCVMVMPECLEQCTFNIQQLSVSTHRGCTLTVHGAGVALGLELSQCSPLIMYSFLYRCSGSQLRYYCYAEGLTRWNSADTGDHGIYIGRDA